MLISITNGLLVRACALVSGFSVFTPSGGSPDMSRILLYRARSRPPNTSWRAAKTANPTAIVLRTTALTMSTSGGLARLRRELLGCDPHLRVLLIGEKTANK